MAESLADKSDAILRDLDIVVPIYKNAALAKKCVDSLLVHLHQISAFHPALLLINDSPGDVDVEDLLKHYTDAGITVHQNQANLGFLKSVNIGLAAAKQKKHNVLLVNSDTQTFDGTLPELLGAAACDPQVGFASPRSNNASICSLPHFFGGVPASPEASHSRWKYLSATLPRFHFVPTAVGFYMFLSFDVIADQGYLEEAFGLGYEEENDLIMRAGKIGRRAIIANRSFAYHAGSASFNLTDLDLSGHRHANLMKLNSRHPEFLPLVRRYESSPHYRAERLMSGLLKDSAGRLKIAFDLRSLGQHFNGTNEQTVAVIRSLAARQCHRINLTGIGSADAFHAHKLDGVANLQREEPGANHMHGIAVRMAQPFEIDQITLLESIAPINVFAMLDTIAEDCGPLAIDTPVGELWDHVASHSNAVLFTSKFAEQTFCNRHPATNTIPRWQKLLPTHLSNYAKRSAASDKSHILVLGNHFPHKGTDAAVGVIASAFPDLSVVSLGSDGSRQPNVTGYRSGLLDQTVVDKMYANASIVVLPSYVEGFGFGFMHALAAKRPIVARRIPATREILATLDNVKGVFLYDHDHELLAACALALQTHESDAEDHRAVSWDDWADEFAEFCLSLVSRDDLFSVLVERISAGDRLRGFVAHKLSHQSVEFSRVPPAPTSTAPAVTLRTLMSMEGKEFVEHAYATILCRPVDEVGLNAYLHQLSVGAHKIDLLKALVTSSEGVQRGVRLAGLAEAIEFREKSSRNWIRRMFG